MSTWNHTGKYLGYLSDSSTGSNNTCSLGNNICNTTMTKSAAFRKKNHQRVFNFKRFWPFFHFFVDIRCALSRKKHPTKSQRVLQNQSLSSVTFLLLSQQLELSRIKLKKKTIVEQAFKTFTFNSHRYYLFCFTSYLPALFHELKLLHWNTGYYIFCIIININIILLFLLLLISLFLSVSELSKTWK